MEGWWERGQGEVPDALFDPQFVCNEEDFTFCKGFGKSGDSYQHSIYAADYRAVNRRAEGKGKGKDKAKGKDKGKEQPAVGSTGQPAVGGEPAVGGKGAQLVQARGLPFTSNILNWKEDGTWQYRTGTCLSLPHVFAKCGPEFTAAQLYAYYNVCRPIASKRPHAWAAPARHTAAI